MILQKTVSLPTVKQEMCCTKPENDWFNHSSSVRLAYTIILISKCEMDHQDGKIIPKSNYFHWVPNCTQRDLWVEVIRCYNAIYSFSDIFITVGSSSISPSAKSRCPSGTNHFLQLLNSWITLLFSTDLTCTFSQGDLQGDSMVWTGNFRRRPQDPLFSPYARYNDKLFHFSFSQNNYTH